MRSYLSHVTWWILSRFGHLLECARLEQEKVVVSAVGENLAWPTNKWATELSSMLILEICCRLPSCRLWNSTSIGLMVQGLSGWSGALLTAWTKFWLSHKYWMFCIESRFASWCKAAASAQRTETDLWYLALTEIDDEFNIDCQLLHTIALTEIIVQYLILILLFNRKIQFEWSTRSHDMVKSSNSTIWTKLLPNLSID